MHRLWIGIACLWLAWGGLSAQAQRRPVEVPRAPSRADSEARGARPPRPPAEAPAARRDVDKRPSKWPVGWQAHPRPFHGWPAWVVVPPPPPPPSPQYGVAFHFWKHPAHRHRPFRYRLRQWLYWDVSGWAPKGPVWLEVEVIYRARVRTLYAGFAVVDLWVEEVMFYDRGRWWGRVTLFPPAMRHLEARFYADGRVVFDRMVFLGEGPEAGLYFMASPGMGGGRPEFIGRLELSQGRIEALPGSAHWPQNAGAWVPLLPTDGAWYAVEPPVHLEPREEVQTFTVEGRPIRLSRRLVVERLE
jgi:hypothetical protein